MHTCQARFFAICSILFNATTVLLLAVSILTFVYEKDSMSGNMKIVSLQPTTTEYKGRHIIFNPNIDLSEKFHINVKQIFLYVKMTRGDQKEMIWSRIVQKNDEKKFVANLFNNYRFFDIDKGAKVTFELRGCVFPYVGLTKDKLFCSTAYKVPSK